MASEEETLERAYLYGGSGWKDLGVVMIPVLIAVVGGIWAISLGCDENRIFGNGAGARSILVGALIIAFGIFWAVVMFVLWVRDRIRPPLVRVTPNALLLPSELRGLPLEEDAQGNPRWDGPRLHPEAIPFRAIRTVRRETSTSPGNDRLLIVHELSPATLKLEQSKMIASDFDELETVLSAEVPKAFVALPVPQTPPPEPTDGV